MSHRFEKPTYELPVDEIIRLSFNLYTSNPFDLVLPFLVAALISTMPSILFPVVWLEQLPWYLALAELVTMLSASLIAGMISWLVSTVATGIAVRYASEIIEGRTPTLNDALTFALSKLISLLAAGIIAAILMVIGFALLIIPGIMLYVMFYLIEPVIVIDQVGAIDALGRSRALVSGRWLKTFGLVLILFLIFVIIGVAVGMLAGIFAFLGPAGRLISSLITGLLSAFIGPLYAVSKTFFYYSMKVKGTGPPPPPP